MSSIRFWARVLLSLVGVVLYVPAYSQISSVQEDAGLRFVTREEGEAIVWVAWELRRGLGSKPDCSHFVNLVYTRAGLGWEYANTDAIFDGIDAFRRVQDPQPGDLVAWKGHVGLVVDPDEHSFYSSVRSGFAIEDYRSDYWTNRGQLRFYRYVIDDVHSARLGAHLKTLPLMPPPTPPVSTAPLPTETDPDLSGANNSPAHNKTITTPPEADTQISDVVFVSSNVLPSRDDVRAALMHLADANRDSLPLLRSTQSIVVAEQVTVVKLDLNDHSGWAELEADSNSSPRCRQGNLNHRAVRWRVTLHREERGWILLLPRDHIYLRRETAARALAHRATSAVTGTAERLDGQTGCASVQ